MSGNKPENVDSKPLPNVGSRYGAFNKLADDIGDLLKDIYKDYGTWIAVYILWLTVIETIEITHYVYF